MKSIIDKVQKDKLAEMEKQLDKIDTELEGIRQTLHAQIGSVIPKRVTEYTPLLFRIANNTEKLVAMIKANIQLLREWL
jgi:hypothetical protein